MADATESVLAFVNRHYADLKKQAQDDNDPANENITAVIALIGKLYKTINKGDASHDEIAGQLKALKTLYNGLSELDLELYSRDIEANHSLHIIVEGLEEVEARAGVGELEPGAGTEGAGV